MDDSRPPSSACSDSTQTPLRNLTTDEQSRVTRRLWARLSAAYGADRWERAYGATVPEAWADALGGCTLADLARGIERCERDDSGRLPTLGQFRVFCREFAPGTFAGASRPSPPTTPLPALPDLCAQSVTGRQWLAFMRLEGMVPMGGATMNDLDRELGDADIDAMRARVAAETARIRARVR